jgi:UDP-glucose 4-epimerase
MNTRFNGKVLLTGANGKLGKALRDLDASRFNADIEWVPLDVVTGVDAGIREGTFTDEALLDELLPGCSAVIHTAALHGRFRKTHSSAEFTDVNVTGLVKLLEGCLKHGVKRFVFSSTMEILIGQDWMASGMAVMDEESTPRPDWIYPANKLAGELSGKFYYAQHGIEFIALRYMSFDKSTKPGPGLLAREVMAHDAATANLLAATLPNLGYAVLNIGPDTPLTNHDIVQAMSDPFSVIEKYWPGAGEVLRAHNVELKPEHFWPATRIERARRVLGWQPQYTFEKYLTELGWQPQ